MERNASAEAIKNEKYKKVTSRPGAVGGRKEGVVVDGGRQWQVVDGMKLQGEEHGLKTKSVAEETLEGKVEFDSQKACQLTPVNSFDFGH
ncbi:hypothetical protein RUM43_005408 [Polyplax serrata]|uniref:Uncharacterized protein n=1 Tax=Polyplax serrata TaxID=468196 RepID=A0AAN8NW00_POLSC